MPQLVSFCTVDLHSLSVAEPHGYLKEMENARNTD